MANDKATGAVHLTTIDLDISGVRQSLEEVDQLVQEAAQRVRETMSGTIAGGGSGQGGSEEEKKPFQATLKQIEELNIKYTQFLSKTRSSNIKNPELTSLISELEQAADALTRYGEAATETGKLSKEDSKDFKDLQKNLRSLKLEYAQMEAAAKDVEEGFSKFAIAGKNFSSAIIPIERLNNSYIQLIGNIKKSSATTEALGDLPQRAEKSAQTVQELVEKIRAHKEVTDEDSSALEQLNALLVKYNGELNKANQTSGKSFTSELIPIERLSNSYQQLLGDIQKSHATTEALGDLPQRAQQAAQSVEQFVSNLREQGKITKEDSAALEKFKLLLVQYNGELKKAQQTEQQSVKTKELTVHQVNQLNQQYEKFLLKLAKSKLTDDALGDIPTQARAASEQMSALANSFRNGEAGSREQQDAFEKLVLLLDDLNRKYTETERRAYETGEGFKTIGEKAKTSGSFIQDFFNKLGDKAKWYLAFQVINTIERSFGEVISTIRETEDAVVEIQRVLNDPSVGDPEVAQRLYDIAYQYGQTFENVQETFVKFAQTGRSFEESTKATEAAMLALNTAELEVNTATMGLIAIMSQFGYEADDLELIIDKINITADNFSVTSEKIVAALQRAGGTAHSFGLSLEETIGIITALSEATGRGGEQIGTALNSLITFSQKSSALEKFTEFLGTDASQFGVLELWQKLSEKIQDGGESLAKMMSTSEEFNDLYDEELSSALGLTEEFNKAQMEAKDVYSTVGTYRQNYFIALLNNIDTAIKAMDNMNAAQGYSAQENEKATQRLTAQWNQLVASAKELAVQFGDQGFLRLLKWLADAGVGVLNLTKTLGGLRTVLLAFITLLVNAKWKTVSDHFTNLNKKLIEHGIQLSTAFSSWSNFKIAVDNARKSMSDFIATTKGTSLAIGAAITIISAIIGAIQRYNEVQKQKRQEDIQAANAAIENTKQINELMAAYKDAEERYKQTGIKTDELTASADALVKKLQEEGIIVEQVGDAYDYLNGNMEKIARLTDAELLRLYQETSDGLEAASKELYNAANDAWAIFRNVEPGAERVYFPIKVDIESPEGQKIAEYAKQAGFEIKENLEEGSEGLYLQVGIDNGDETIETIAKLNEFIGLMASGFTASAIEQNKWLDGIMAFLDDTQEAAAEYSNLNNALNDYDQALTKTADDQEDANKPLRDSEAILDAIAERIEKVQEKTKSFSDSWDTLVGAIDDYNEAGGLSADTLESLLELEPEYIALLEVKDGKLGLNEQRTQSLMATNREYMQQLAALRLAENAENLATELQAAAKEGLSLAEYRAQVQSKVFSSEIYNAALKMMQGQISAGAFAEAVNNVGKQAGLAGGYLAYFRGEVESMFNSVNSLMQMPMDFKVPTVSGGGGGGGSSAASKEKEAIQAEIDAWKEREEEVKDYYDKLKKDTEDYYDGLIDQLKSVEKENDRINDQLDYYNDRQKTVTNLEQARSRSGIEWREKELEYQQDLIDLDEDWRRKQQDWDIEDRIDELERLKDAAVEQIEAAADAAIAEIEKTIEALQDKVNAMSKAVGGGVSASVKSGTDAMRESYSNFLGEMKTKTENTYTALIDKIGEQAGIAAPQWTQLINNKFSAPVNETLDAMRGKIESITSVMAHIFGPAAGIVSTGVSGLWNTLSSGLGLGGTRNSTFNMYASIGNNSAANSVTNGVLGYLRSQRF